MFDEAVSLLSLWASMHSWLTPTVLFLLLNLMIGTIVVTSGFTSSKPHHLNHPDSAFHHHHQHHQSPQLTRAPSVLQRLKSINFYSYHTHNPPSTTLVHQHIPSPASDPLIDSKPEPRLPRVPARASFPAQTQTQSRTLVLDEGILIPQTQTPTQTSELEEDIIDDDGPTLEEIYSRIKGTSSVHYNRQMSDTMPAGGEIPVKLPAKIKKSASDKSAFNHFKAVEEPENAAPSAVVEASGGSEVDARADDFINRFKKQLQLQKMESIVRLEEMITRGSGK